MIAYAAGAMSLSDWFRRMFSSHSETDEEAAAMHEEYGAQDEGEADVRRMETTAGGAVMPGIYGSAGAEAAEAEIESEEGPRDPAP
jgi:hypothetical protein